MRPKLDRLERSWRRTRVFFWIFSFGIALIVGINIASGPEASGGSALRQLGYGLLMLVGATIVVGFNWLIYKFMRRWAQHEDSLE